MNPRQQAITYAVAVLAFVAAAYAAWDGQLRRYRVLLAFGFVAIALVPLVTALRAV